MKDFTLPIDVRKKNFASFLFCKDDKEFHETIKFLTGQKMDKNTAAVYIPGPLIIDDFSKIHIKKEKLFGVIIFNENELTIPVILHECTHCILDFFEYKNILHKLYTTKNNEYFCYLLHVFFGRAINKVADLYKKFDFETPQVLEEDFKEAAKGYRF